jgi:cell fate (sporulation/competence/biofilm development) regulator YlbF (YheA/YmcA/DUF963 family)
MFIINEKNSTFLFFYFSISVAQTIEDRNKIKQSYNKVKVASLTAELFTNLEQQKKKIEAYKQTNKFIESETKSLQRIYDGLPIFYSVDNDQSVNFTC